MRSIGHSIALLGITGLLAAVLIAGASLWGEQRSSQGAQQTFVAKDVTADILPPPMYLIELRLVLSQAKEGTLDLARAGAEVERLANEYAQRVAHWQARPPYGLERQLLGDQHAAGQQFIGAAKDFIEALIAGHADRAAAAFTTAGGHYEAHRKGVDATVEASVAFASTSIAGFEQTGRQAQLIQWGVFGAAVLLLAGLSVWVNRRISTPIREAVRVARAVASGDLASTIEVKGADETGQLLQALKDMNTSLVGIVGQVRESSDSIATGSAQIASGNSDLSQRTETQAGNLQQTASSMEQLSATVRQNADAARQANAMAASCSEAATRGGEVVNQVVGTMTRISTSSQKIGDIIGVIDGIAFQTNILALNAAVEAARAGEQGRGFAVVAAEVRSLARRSADAAREIKQLIGASVDTVDEGTKLVRDAGQSMQDIMSRVTGVTSLIAEISAAGVEQTQGIGEVGAAVHELDRATQQNAALVEESAAAAESLRQQAARLAEVVRTFRLAGQPG